MKYSPDTQKVCNVIVLPVHKPIWITDQFGPLNVLTTLFIEISSRVSTVATCSYPVVKRNYLNQLIIQ